MNAETALPDIVNTGPEIMVFDEDWSRGAIMASLSERIPRNEYGLPTFIFRSDLLHGNHFAADDLDAAVISLNYAEGYPTLPSGGSFWNQLPHEAQSNFELFQGYLDQGAELGIRQLDVLSVGTDKTPSQLLDLYHEYFWSARARAYDLFITAAQAKKRLARVRQMEDDHYDVAGKLLDKVQERFKGEFDDWIEELDAKEAVEVLSELVKIQRMSTGLVGQHASSTAKDIGPGESAENVLRKLAQGAGAERSGSDNFQAKLQMLLKDPEKGDVLQAAILEVTAGNNRQEFREDL
jgi:hypothetical protein